MTDTTIVPVSMPRRMAAIIDVRARRLAMTRSEYIRTLVRREVDTPEAQDDAIVTALKVAERELKSGKTKVLKKGGLAAMLK
jgi:metal-responsive CopG/Arc/MetJ family transcriptional regulator